MLYELLPYLLRAGPEQQFSTLEHLRTRIASEAGTGMAGEQH